MLKEARAALVQGKLSRNNHQVLGLQLESNLDQELPDESILIHIHEHFAHVG